MNRIGWLFSLIMDRIYQTPLLLTAFKALKCLIHVTTGTSEIYRLCNSTIVLQKVLVEEEEKESTVARHLESIISEKVIYRIDRSIFYSTQLIKEKHQLAASSCRINEVLESIVVKKDFPRHSTSTTEAQVLCSCLTRIHQANQLLNEIEEQISTKYNTEDNSHQEKLMRLWNLLKPDVKLESRHTKQWVDIGFQGTNPATDFRGMGIQGLDDLLYFSTTHPTHAITVLQHASHPIYWYPYAIVGINITKFTYQLLETKKLRMYLFKYGPTMETLSEFYCWLFFKFNQFWITHEPALTVMDFESKLVEFKKAVEQELIEDKVEPFSMYIVTVTSSDKQKVDDVDDKKTV